VTLAVPRAADALLSTVAIRERCGNVAAAVSASHSRWFRVDRARLAPTAAFVADVTRDRYPDLIIPYHSRWRHFEAGGVDRRSELDRALAGRSTADRARAHVDLAMVSVLLDAGAGPAWRYVERATGKSFTRSEGLGVASFRAFMQGAFSSVPDDPCRVDAEALAALNAPALGALFAVDAANPLVGLDGRVALLQRMAAALTAQRDVFGATARPGGLFDTLMARDKTRVSAAAILRALLDGLGGIWLTGSTLDGVALGDTWRHPHAGGSGETAGWVPFHKLSQWLTYSLFEPFEWAGVTITDRDSLAGLPEYRNGGLLLDGGVVKLVNDAEALVPWDVGSELVVEWRALTVTLLDELAPLVRIKLGVPDLPLACILEGGTWAAGRRFATDLRNGDPPLAIRSDGTVF
jgi:hypothetical protein